MWYQNLKSHIGIISMALMSIPALPDSSYRTHAVLGKVVLSLGEIKMRLAFGLDLE